MRPYCFPKYYDVRLRLLSNLPRHNERQFMLLSRFVATSYCPCLYLSPSQAFRGWDSGDTKIWFRGDPNMRSLRLCIVCAGKYLDRHGATLGLLYSYCIPFLLQSLHLLLASTLAVDLKCPFLQNSFILSVPLALLVSQSLM